jgi:hypothetical protein
MRIHGKVSMITFMFAAVLCFFTNLTNGFFWLLPAIKNSYHMIVGNERTFDLPFKAA